MVADLWQHLFAKYGDTSGSRTWGKAVSAGKKRDTYFAVLGQLLATK